VESPDTAVTSILITLNVNDTFYMLLCSWTNLALENWYILSKRVKNYALLSELCIDCEVELEGPQ
jgi:hypothetical protein